MPPLGAAYLTGLVLLLGIGSLYGNAALPKVLASCPVELLPSAGDVDGFGLGLRYPGRLPGMDGNEDGNGKQEDSKK